MTYSARTMGTYAQVKVVTADSAGSGPAVAAAQSALQRVDSLMSNWTSTSEVARLNHSAAAAEQRVEPEVSRVLETAVRVGRESGGAFDITVEPLVRAWGFLGGPRRVPRPAAADSARALIGPDRIAFDPAHATLRFDREGVRIDLGGIAKGHAVDCAAETLITRGVDAALVDVSGNMRAFGTPPGAPSWRIGIRDPRDRVPQLGTLRLARGGIATSGKYEQFVAQDGRTYGHILDPRTGVPSDGLIAVTVIAPSAMLADAWSTALFVLGPTEARRIAVERADLDVIVVEPVPGGADIVWIESSLRERFIPDRLAAGHVSFRHF